MSFAGPGPELEASAEAAPGPRAASFELAVDLRSAARARGAVGEALSAWGVHDQQVRYDVLLLTSELVANAVRYGEETVTLHLQLDGGDLEVAVEDGSPALPTQPENLVDNPYREGGRGLLIVGELAREWGIDDASSSGKRVWARISATRSA